MGSQLLATDATAQRRPDVELSRPHDQGIQEHRGGARGILRSRQIHPSRQHSSECPAFYAQGWKITGHADYDAEEIARCCLDVLSVPVSRFDREESKLALRPWIPVSVLMSSTMCWASVGW